MKHSVALLGAPMWLGQTKYGTNLAPEALRAAGLAHQLQKSGLVVSDMGDIAMSTSGSFKIDMSRTKNIRQVAAGCTKLAKQVAQIAGQGFFPLVMGGDHSVAIGTLAGLGRVYNNVGVIWFDAHADMNTPETSPSGNIHGMPLAVSMGMGHPELLKVRQGMAPLNPSNIVLVGARDIDAGEQALIDRLQIKVFPSEVVRAKGVTTVMLEAVSYLAKHCDAIHLSFDLDGIDPCQAPGVGTPVADGMEYRECLDALAALARTGKLTSAEFVELNPVLDAGAVTTNMTVNLIGALLGVFAMDATGEAADERVSAGLC